MWGLAVEGQLWQRGHRRVVALAAGRYLGGMRYLLTLLLLFVAAPTLAGEPVDSINRAIVLFEAAAPGLGGEAQGVDVSAYRAALSEGRSVAMVTEGDPASRCGSFAAYTLLPAQDGVVRLVFCPRFFSGGNDSLRTLTVLHEMVHVVAGANECRAMAFAARVEQLATGTHTPVAAYWQANGCDGSGFSLP
jgi:hypothetical protein